MSDTAIWSKADLHIHTDQSDGIAKVPDLMEYVKDHTDLKVIAVTDHNTVEGGLFARELAELYDFEVIVGEEVSAKEGHVIGLFIEETIRPGMSAADTIRAIREQDGVVVIPHPFSAQGVFGPGGHGRFLAAVEEWGFDAFEVHNSLPYLGWANGRANKLLSSGHRLAATGGSDAHVLKAVGKCYTEFPGETAEDLRAAVLRGETRATAEKQGLSLAWRYVVRYPQIRRRQSWNWERCKAVK